jgi:hypothetical protein
LWWLWGVGQAQVAAEVIIRLHDEDRPVGHDRNQPIIMGWPFSVGFERYLDAEWGKSPFRSTMAQFYNPRKRGYASQSLEYRILWALISGHTDADVVCAVLGGPHRDYFEDAAVRALSSIWDRGELMRALAIETDGLPLELTEPKVKKKFSLLCAGDCGRADCAIERDPPGAA